MDVGTAQQLFTSYRQGLLKPNAATPPARTTSFAHLTNCALLNVAPLRERRLFHRSYAAATQGLGKTRAGDLEGASLSFARSRAALEDGGSGAAVLIAVSFLAAAEAYLDTRQGDFERARQRLELSFDADLRLELEFGLGFLQLHRVQNVHNAARLFWKCERLAEGCALTGAVAAFLEERRSSLPIHRQWSWRRLSHSPPSLRRAMLAQVLEETAFHLARRPSEAGWKALIDAAGLDALPAAPRSCLHPRAYLWLRAERARLAGDEEAYLELLPAFLAGGRHEIGTIWYLAVATFADFCRTRSSKESLYVRSAILRDSVKWPQVPPPISEWLSQTAPG